MAKLRREGPPFDPALLDTRVESWLTQDERDRLAELADDYRADVRDRNGERARATSDAIDTECHVLARYRIVGGCSVAAAEADWARKRRIGAQRAAGWHVAFDGTVTAGPAEAMATPEDVRAAS